jgi:hypothetical protein
MKLRINSPLTHLRSSYTHPHSPLGSDKSNVEGGEWKSEGLVLKELLFWTAIDQRDKGKPLAFSLSPKYAF